jgi:hypothetical protein
MEPSFRALLSYSGQVFEALAVFSSNSLESFLFSEARSGPRAIPFNGIT